MRSLRDAIVPERLPGEVFTDYLERIVRVNGWHNGGVKAMPEGVRLPYRDPEDRGDDPDNY